MKFLPPLLLATFAASVLAAEIEPLPNTKPLNIEGDLASQMISGIDSFLTQEFRRVTNLRHAQAKRDAASLETFTAAIEGKRKRLAHILGVVDPRVPFAAPELVATTDQPALVCRFPGAKPEDNPDEFDGKRKREKVVAGAGAFEVYAIRWPVLADPQPDRKIASIYGEGLLLVPTGREPIADIVAIPHCDHTPEQLAGLSPGMPPDQQFARRLAEAGCRVVVPMLINRENYIDTLTNREFLYRSSFELGRHIIGYELQKVLAIVDWFAASKRKIGVAGHGEGGMLALYAGALDPRIDGTYVSGYFGRHDTYWTEPLDRNVFGRWVGFGDCELAEMIVPRTLIVNLLNRNAVPERNWSGGLGAPAVIKNEMIEDAIAAMTDGATPKEFGERLAARAMEAPADTLCFIRSLLGEAGVDAWKNSSQAHVEIADLRKSFNPAARHLDQFNQIDRHNQALLRQSIVVRDAFTKPLRDAAAKGPAEYEKTAAEFRRKFYDDTIGRFDIPLAPANPRSRKVAESDKWTRYEVVLDVFGKTTGESATTDVFAYGILIVPKGIAANEKRPVVVCQHGLEGRPINVVEGDNKSYHDFATKLAERGYITFAPQNPYIFKDRFRELQRKANPLGKTLFSFIVPQHQQIVNWLKTLPQVAPDKIGFYGLSYGGKTAMRVPAIVTDYALSICSADFNEWVWKNAATDAFARRYTYATKNEYEIFEWDLGSTWNYAEMAMLIAPRPFMVERGHQDGVAPDETVAWEFARVQRFYSVDLKLPTRARIEWFNGPHTINGKGTFEFLDEWLKK